MRCKPCFFHYRRRAFIVNEVGLTHMMLERVCSGRAGERHNSCLFPLLLCLSVLRHRQTAFCLSVKSKKQDSRRSLASLSWLISFGFVLCVSSFCTPHLTRSLVRLLWLLCSHLFTDRQSARKSNRPCSKLCVDPLFIVVACCRWYCVWYYQSRVRSLIDRGWVMDR